MNYWWRLDGRTPAPCSLEEWIVAAGEREAGIRSGADPWQVARTEDGGVVVSTVFLGIDHSFVGGPPVLFETMIFGGDHDGEQSRAVTWADAERNHEEACRSARDPHDPHICPYCGGTGWGDVTEAPCVPCDGTVEDGAP